MPSEDIPQHQYENICDNLGMSAYIDESDETNDVRYRTVGDILERMAAILEEIERAR